MIKKLGLFVLLFSYTYVSFAAKELIYPDIVSIKKIKNCYACVELKNNGEVLGSLQPDTQKKDVFYFLNAHGQRQLTIKHSENILFYSISHDSNLISNCFEVLDKNNTLIAKLKFTSDTSGFAFFNFQIMDPDKAKLIEGDEEIFGKYTRIYDVRFGRHFIGYLRKPLFTFSLDAELHISDKQELSYFMDPNIFFATLAINSNYDFFYSNENYYSSEKISKSLSIDSLYKLRKKILDMAESRGITLSQHPTDLSVKELEAAKKFISQRYLETYGEDFWNRENRDKNKKLNQIISLGFDIIWSLNQSPQEDYAMLQFLIGCLDKDAIEKM